MRSSSTPAVFEVAVMGVPDEMMGEKVGAIIVPRPGTEPDPQEIRAFVKERIADFKVPQFISFRTDPLPRNPAARCSSPRCAKTRSGATRSAKLILSLLGVKRRR